MPACGAIIPCAMPMSLLVMPPENRTTGTGARADTTFRRVESIPLMVLRNTRTVRASVTGGTRRKAIAPSGEILSISHLSDPPTR